MFLHILDLFLVPCSPSYNFDDDGFVFLLGLEFVPDNHFEAVEKRVKLFNIVVSSKHLNNLLIP